MSTYRELLAVIVAAAVTLLFTTAAVKQRTPAWNNQQCQANLKMLYQAEALYSQDFNGELPMFVLQRRPQRWLWWSDFVLPYVKEPRCYYCPANPRAAIQFDKDLADELLPPVYDVKSLSYGMNYQLGGAVELGKPIPTNSHRLTDIKYPAKVVLLADSKTPYLRGTKWCWKTDANPVHQERFNIVNCDGNTLSAGKDNFGMQQAFDGWKEDPSFWK